MKKKEQRIYPFYFGGDVRSGEDLEFPDDLRTRWNPTHCTPQEIKEACRDRGRVEWEEIGGNSYVSIWLTPPKR